MDLNQITLPVTDITQAIEFYLKMGFTQIVDSPHYARFSCPTGNATFSVSLNKTPIKHGATIYFESEKLNDWVALLQTRGIVFEQMPIKQSYLWTEAVLKDPSNNTIKLYYAGQNRLNPPWRVNRTYGDKK